nr:hypothetical protein [Alicyclobacillus macrosporangiidus]
MTQPKDYHCCATCIHFKAERTHGQLRIYCSRLGYDTKPYYKFNCWDPKPGIGRGLEWRQQMILVDNWTS